MGIRGKAYVYVSVERKLASDRVSDKWRGGMDYLWCQLMPGKLWYLVSIGDGGTTNENDLFE